MKDIDKQLLSDVFDTLFVLGASIASAIFFNNPWAGCAVGCILALYIRKK